MKYIVVASLAAVGFAAIYANGCSRSDQEAVGERVREAGDALLGNPEGEGREPKIVREQMRKERIRQETKWTPENQARHPIEYCQAHSRRSMRRWMPLTRGRIRGLRRSKR